MNYYEHHIGDYLAAAAHLTLLEHGCYLRLLHVYYRDEAPIAAADACRKVGARTDEERAAVADILTEFFTLDGEVYRHARCDREIARYRDKQLKAKASADKRWTNAPSLPKECEGNANAVPTHCEGSALQAPSTKHQAPEDKPPVVRARARAPTRAAKKAPDGFEVTSEMREWAASDAPGIDIDRETAKFRDHTFSNARADWQATWRNWMRRASEGAISSTQRRRPSTATERGAGVFGYIAQYAAAEDKSSTATADEVVGLADIDESGASPFEKARELPYVDRVF